jgi:hypothetical protein
MKENMEQLDYAALCAEFEKVAMEYEEASRSMLRVARDSGATAEEFKWISGHVARLADHMKTLRAAMSTMRKIRNMPGAPCNPLRPVDGVDAPPAGNPGDTAQAA